MQCMDRRVTFEAPGQGAARRRSGKQGRADPHSPAVTAQRDHQPSKGLHRASLSSPAVGSGGPRQHRRASLGGGGVLPLEGHSFLLTGYDDDKQKKVVTQRIIKLGGFVLEDIPKPPVLTMLTRQLMCTVLPCFAWPYHAALLVINLVINSCSTNGFLGEGGGGGWVHLICSQLLRHCKLHEQSALFV